jgi:hypothetical protein
MKLYKGLFYLSFIGMSITISFLLFGCFLLNLRSKPPNEAKNTTNGDEYQEDIYGLRFNLLGSAYINNPITLAFSIEPRIDIPDLNIKIIAPDGVTQVNKKCSWYINAIAGNRVDFECEIVINTLGIHVIRLVISTPLGEAYERIHYIYINSTGINGSIITPPPKTDYPTEQQSYPLNP